MAFPDQFSLRWNDFVSNVTTSFASLLTQKDMADVTVAAEGQYLHAHKLILSIASPYFKQLFKMNPCEHPIVILRDVTFQELEQLHQFIYTGEVHIKRNDLSHFLHTAEMLQVKGLCSPTDLADSPDINMDKEEPVGEEPAQEEAAACPLAEEYASSEAPTERALVNGEAPKSPLRRLLKHSSAKNREGVKKEPQSLVSTLETKFYNNETEPVIDFDNDLFPSVMMPESAKDSAGWNSNSPLVKGVKCPNCHRFFANRYNLKVHIRDKHDTREGTLQCEICKKRMRNPSCLRVHMYHHRKQAAYLAQIGREGQMKSPITNWVEGVNQSTWTSDAALRNAKVKDEQVPMEGQEKPLAGAWANAEGANEGDSESFRGLSGFENEPAAKSESDHEEV